jgi:hypothetical protein
MSNRVQTSVKAASRSPSAPTHTGPLQGRFTNQPEASAVPSIVPEVLRSPGQPLEPDTRAFMESRFGHDFSQVRVHTDAQAAESARMANARAYTVGREIVFGIGQYAPKTTAGKRLLAHELTHVVQQAGSLTLQRQVDKAVPPALPPEKAALPPTEGEEAIEVGEIAGPELSPERIESPPEAIYVSEDLAPESEAEGVPEAGIAAAPAGPAPASLAHQIVPPDHASEREAEAVSQAIISGPEKGGPLRVSSIFPAARGFVQRQLFWDVQNTLGWPDFKGKAPKASPFDALTASGFKMAAPKVQKEANPSPPFAPDKCKIGNTTTTKFSATVSLDISPASLDVRAFMQPTKSWVKPGKQSPALLLHEQGHFDISHVIAEKTEFAIMLWAIQNVGTAEKCGKAPALNAATKAWNAMNPNKAIQKIFNKGHGVNAAAQKAWQGDISGDLPGYDVF